MSTSKTRLYIGRLSSRTRQRDLEDIFQKYGRIVRCDLKQNYAFVEFDDARDANEAVKELDGTSLDGSKISVEYSRGTPGRNGGGGGGGGGGDRGSSGRGRIGRPVSIKGPPQRSDYRIIIENIPRDLSWQDLKDHYRKSGEVLFGDVYEDERTGKFKGVVEFKFYEDMKRAIRDTDNTRFRGSTIYVFEDENKTYVPKRRSPRSSPRRSPRRSRRSRSRSRSPRRRSRSKSRSKSKSRSPKRQRSGSRGRGSRGRSKERSPADRSSTKARERSASPSRATSPRKSPGGVSPKTDGSPHNYD